MSLSKKYLYSYISPITHSGRASFPGFWQIGESGSRKKIYKVQTIKGNQAERNYHLSGSLVTYQCGEAVVNGKDQMPEP